MIQVFDKDNKRVDAGRWLQEQAGGCWLPMFRSKHQKPVYRWFLPAGKYRASAPTNGSK